MNKAEMWRYASVLIPASFLLTSCGDNTPVNQPLIPYVTQMPTLEPTKEQAVSRLPTKQNKTNTPVILPTLAQATERIQTPVTPTLVAKSTNVPLLSASSTQYRLNTSQSTECSLTRGKVVVRGKLEISKSDKTASGALVFSNTHPDKIIDPKTMEINPEVSGYKILMENGSYSVAIFSASKRVNAVGDTQYTERINYAQPVSAPKNNGLSFSVEQKGGRASIGYMPNEYDTPPTNIPSIIASPFKDPNGPVYVFVTAVNTEASFEGVCSS